MTSFKISKAEKKVLQRVDSETFRGHKIGELRKIFDLYQDREWKKPIMAVVQSEEQAKKLSDAIIFFQADVPKIRQEVAYVYPHKDALIKVQKPIWIVESRGYQAY